MNKSKLLLIIILFSGHIQAQAQDSVSTDESMQESSLSSTDIIAEEAEVNSSSILTDNTETNIIALAPFTEVAPGVCLVIGNMLSSFCDSNPQDMSCQFQ